MKRSKFSLSHYKLLSCDMGSLVPIACFEVLPGDSIQQSSSLLVRVSPLLAPVMHPVVVRVHHWFVPYRLIWEDFEDFITGGPDGADQSVFPTKPNATVTPLGDYLGLPPGSANVPVSALPFRAYAMIYNEHYRDQDLQSEVALSIASGSDAITSTALMNCDWEKDYFTSARPWTQKGPSVSVPIGTTAPVLSSGVMPTMRNVAGTGSAAGLHADSTGFLQAATGGLNALPESDLEWVETGMVVDLNAATSATINELRTAFALQRYAEARARYGSRYTEYLRYLGVQSSDARLQRPEYLGGGKQVIQFSEVLQTAPDVSAGETVEGVGNLRGHGIGAMRSNRYRRFFEEHGVVVSLLSVLPRTMYAQGLSRMWNRRIKEDFFQAELQHIGQQEILAKEIYAAAALPDGVWGYQDRYDEYRRHESGVAGDFRGTLDHWHYARIFSNEPVLNGSFVEAVPTKRPNAVQSEDVLWIMANHSIQARRLVAREATSHIF